MVVGLVVMLVGVENLGRVVASQKFNGAPKMFGWFPFNVDVLCGWMCAEKP